MDRLEARTYAARPRGVTRGVFGMKSLRSVRARLFAGVIAGVVGVGSIGSQIALAADIETSIELVTVTTSVFYGDEATYTAQVTPETNEGSVLFEYTTDGENWLVLWQDDEIWNGVGAFLDTQVDNDTFEGVRQIRATYLSAPGYVGSTSQLVAQTLDHREVEFSNVRLVNLDTVNPTAPVLPGSNARIQAELNISTGSLAFDRFVDGGWVEVGSTAIVYSDGLKAMLNLGPLGEGSHAFRLRHGGTAFYLGKTLETTFDVTRATPWPWMFAPASVQANHPFQATAWTTFPVTAGSAQMQILKLPARTVIASGGPDSSTVELPALAVGSHQFVAHYPGDVNYAPADGDPWTVTVTPDIVEATGVGVQYTPFYPYVDGYRDTVKISGYRDEPIAVSTKIYSSTGSLVLAASIARAPGPYATTWNGRNAAGTMRPAGAYKVVQTLTDEFGTTKVVTSSLTLSAKKLVTKTSYVTRKGSSISAKGDPGGGSITVSTTAGTAKLVGKYPSGWVGVGYAFTLPSATVYKSIAFQVYAKALFTAPANSIGMQKFTTCPYSSTAAWDESCFDRWKSIGSGSTSAVWYSTSGSVTANRYNRVVRGLVSVNTGTVTIYSTRVKVVYQVLQ
jgi:hypothetical protein